MQLIAAPQSAMHPAPHPATPHPVKALGASAAAGSPGLQALVVKHLGVMPYAETLAAMRAFTLARVEHTPDEIWLTEHPAVYTLGLAGRREHVQDTGGIAVVQSDRGGQVTYHGPGQVIAYLLIDLARRDLKVREFVHLIEDAVLATLAGYGVQGERRRGMPGVYVAGAKIAALGLKVKQGCSYHGLGLNVDMDLAPFAGIDPCGYQGLAVTSLAALGVTAGCAAVGAAVAAQLGRALDGAAGQASAR